MKLIDDPSAVVELFRRRGLKPKSGMFTGNIAEGECCILSALYCDARGCDSPIACLSEIDQRLDEEPYNTAEEFIAPAVGIDPQYATGLMEAWDDEDIEPDESEPKLLFLGHAHGRAARKACEAAGMMPPLVPSVDDGEIEDFDEEEDDEW